MVGWIDSGRPLATMRSERRDCGERTLLSDIEAPLGAEDPRDGGESDLADFVADLVADLPLSEEETTAILAGARSRMSTLVETRSDGAHAFHVAEAAAVARTVAELGSDGRLGRQRVERLVGRLAHRTGLPAELVGLSLYLEVLREPYLLALPPDQAIAAQLGVLLDFAPIDEASLWTPDGDGRLRCASRRERRSKPGRATSDAIAHTHSGRRRTEGPVTETVPVLRWQRPFGSLVIQAQANERDQALAFAEEAAATLALAVERLALLERNAERDLHLLESSERRLARVGLDLHDGPIQGVSALAGELRLLARQLAGVVGGDHRELMLGRIADLEAHLIALDRELREMASSVESSALLTKPLAELLADEVESFSKRHDMEAELEIHGNLDSLTASQHIALLRVVQEALANAGAHSQGSEVSVTVFGGQTQLSVEVTDDGRGFDVEEMLVEAARKGRLGLVGMNERVRLLGGRFDLQSRSGGPTTVSAIIPRWRPLDEDRQSAGESATPDLVSG
jgi:signal transduction histidine kinase